jgi:hypothetical protein
MATPAFGGRMLDHAGPAEVTRGMEREPTEAAVDERADEYEDPLEDPDLRPEGAEGADDDMTVPADPTSPPSRWRWVRSLSLGVSADDNINLSSSHKVSDQIFTLNGNFQLLWGLKKEESFLAMEYAPSVSVYAGNGRADSLDQKGSISGQWQTAKLTLGAQVSGQTLSGGDVDIGDRANRRLWQISLQANYDYSTKTSFEVSLAPNASDYTHYLDSIEWINGNWIDYQILPKTRLGAGLTFGYLQQQGGRPQTYQQALLRITNPVSGKISFHASGGVEYREFGSGAGNQTTPVFTAGANYQPYERTEILGELSRKIYSSASLAGENFVSTGGTATIRQRVFNRCVVGLAGGYEDAQYESTVGQGGASRHDQYLFVRPSVSFAFKKWVNLDLYYQYRRNTSTSGSSAFDNTVAGLQATVSF